MTKTVTVSTRLDAKLLERLDAYVEATPGSRGEHIRLAIIAYLDAHKGLSSRVERIERLLWPDD